MCAPFPRDHLSERDFVDRCDARLYLTEQTGCGYAYGALRAMQARAGKFVHIHYCSTCREFVGKFTYDSASFSP